MRRLRSLTRRDFLGFAVAAVGAIWPAPRSSATGRKKPAPTPTSAAASAQASAQFVEMDVSADSLRELAGATDAAVAEVAEVL